MARRRLSVFDHRQIIVLLRAGESARSIASRGLAGRNKVKKVRKKAQRLGWLDPVRPTPTEEEVAEAFAGELRPPVPPQESLVERFREEVARWAEEGLQATTIWNALRRKHQFHGSYGSVLRFVQKLEDKPPEAFVPLDFLPGELAQVDFGAGPMLPDPLTGKPRKTHVFVMTLAYSRHMYAELVWDQKVETWLCCHRNAFEFLGGLVSRVRMDNLKAAIIRACRYDPVVQKSYEEFAEAWGFLVDPIVKRKPNHNGRAERGVAYVKKSFLPLREFRSLGNANQQLLEWVLGEAGNRVHGSTHRVPLEVFAQEERAALRPLPAERPELVLWAQATLHPDCLLTYEKGYYSAPSRLVRQRLDLHVGERLVTVYHERQPVAVHARTTRPGQRRINPEHFPPEKQAYMMSTPTWCREQARQVGPHCARFVEELFSRGVLYRLKAAQGTLHLRQRYGSARLEAACHRALAYDNLAYHAVKRILEAGLDQVPLDEGEGGQLQLPFLEAPRFARNIGQMLS